MRCDILCWITDVQEISFDSLKNKSQNQSIQRDKKGKDVCLHCRDQLPASRCTASAYPLSSSHLGRNCRTEAHVNFSDINLHCNKYDWQGMTSSQMSGVTLWRSQRGGGGGGGWCSSCLMYSSARSLALGTEITAGCVHSRFAEVRIGHPEIHYRSVCGAHLEAALQQQITANDPSLSLPLSPFLCSSLSLTLLSSACFLSNCASRIPPFSSHSIQLCMSSTGGRAECIVKVLKLQLWKRLTRNDFLL